MGYGSSAGVARIIPLRSDEGELLTQKDTEKQQQRRKSEAAATAANLPLDVVERVEEARDSRDPQKKAAIGFSDAAFCAAASDNGGENISYNKYLQVCDLTLKSLYEMMDAN